MADVNLVAADSLKPGDKLGQDIMAGSQVLLRSGTELNEVQIQRIQRLGLAQVALQLSSSAAQAAVAPSPKVEAKLPSFRDLAQTDDASWMADASFAQPVAPMGALSNTEQMFARSKRELRESAGLKPLVDYELDNHIKKEVHAAFISSVLKKEVNLDQLASAAKDLVSAIGENPEGILSFEDVQQYGQYLAATAVMSSKVFHHSRPESINGDLGEHVRCNFALTNALALLPFDLPFTQDQTSADQRKRFREALLRYYEWLRSKRFFGEKMLELVLLQHERFDGAGLPYGLSGEMVPPVSEAWSVARAFSQRLYSTTRSPRVTGREAADHLITQSGRSFSARGVNRLLTTVGYYPTGSLVELNDSNTALVVSQNERALLKPMVQLVAPDGSTGGQLDLQQTPELYIRKQVLEY